MRRRKLLVALAGLAVVVAAGAVVLWPRTERITQENYDRIQLGMSRAHVYTVLGPPGDYATHPTYGYIGSGPWNRQPGEESWVANETVIWVQFDGTSKVVHASFGGNAPKPANGYQVLLWYANHQRHRWFPE
jgi:hypothetical protein